MDIAVPAEGAPPILSEAPPGNNVAVQQLADARGRAEALQNEAKKWQKVHAGKQRFFSQRFF